MSAVGDRTITAAIHTVQPKVSGEDLAKRYPVVLAVDRGNFRISLFKKLKKVKAYPIAVGQVGLETPAGLYKIQNKAINPAWHVPNSDWAGKLAGTVIPGGAPNNPLKARWLGVYDGVGVHGTDARGSIGSNASHGCIRMLIEDVEALYDQVPIGTPIYIHSRPADAALRADADSDRRDLLPPRRQQQGMMGRVSKDERADEDPPLPLAHDRVPHRRSVARPLYAQPRPRRDARRRGDPGFDQLVLGSDRPMIRVDEEDAHRTRG